MQNKFAYRLLFHYSKYKNHTMNVQRVKLFQKILSESQCSAMRNLADVFILMTPDTHLDFFF